MLAGWSDDHSCGCAAANGRALNSGNIAPVRYCDPGRRTVPATQPSCSWMIKSCGFATPPHSGCAFRRLPCCATYAGCGTKTRLTSAAGPGS